MTATHRQAQRHLLGYSDLCAHTHPPSTQPRGSPSPFFFLSLLQPILHSLALNLTTDLYYPSRAHSALVFIRLPPAQPYVTSTVCVEIAPFLSPRLDSSRAGLTRGPRRRVCSVPRGLLPGLAGGPPRGAPRLPARRRRGRRGRRTRRRAHRAPRGSSLRRRRRP